VKRKIFFLESQESYKKEFLKSIHLAYQIWNEVYEILETEMSVDIASMN